MEYCERCGQPVYHAMGECPYDEEIAEKVQGDLRRYEEAEEQKLDQ